MILTFCYCQQRTNCPLHDTLAPSGEIPHHRFSSEILSVAEAVASPIWRGYFQVANLANWFATKMPAKFHKGVCRLESLLKNDATRKQVREERLQPSSLFRVASIRGAACDAVSNRAASRYASIMSPESDALSFEWNDNPQANRIVGRFSRKYSLFVPSS